MEPISALIADDEELARRGIALRLAAQPDFRVVAECGNGREAIAAIGEQRPQVIFLDIQMPGLSGFDVLDALPAEHTPLVVFTTAFDQHALQAFAAHAADYLLKPIDEQRFAASLERIRLRLREQRSLQKLEQLLDLAGELRPTSQAGRAARYPEVIAVRQGSSTLRVPAASIDWIDAAGDYLCLHSGGQTHVLRSTMGEMETMLDPTLFQRVHRSTIVNLRCVRSLRSHTNGECFLRLDSGEELKLSRSYRGKIQQFLKS